MKYICMDTYICIFTTIPCSFLAARVLPTILEAFDFSSESLQLLQRVNGLYMEYMEYIVYGSKSGLDYVWAMFGIALCQEYLWLWYFKDLVNFLQLTYSYSVQFLGQHKCWPWLGPHLPSSISRLAKLFTLSRLNNGHFNTMLILGICKDHVWTVYMPYLT